MKAASHNEENKMTTNTATYCPEDNKLRLYVGRVPRDEYEALRAEGWTSTPKQSCDFAATWTPARVARCYQYAETIDDEDAGPAERAADRAERFAGYRDNRTADAIGHADRYDAGPLAHGYQSQARADRAAARHDRQAGHAVDAWSKAEYWTRRTAGVISHALYVSTPAVRMGRIKTLEAELRKTRAHIEEARKVHAWFTRAAALPDGEKKTEIVKALVGNHSHSYDHKHPRPETCKPYHKTNATSLYSLMDDECDPLTAAEACALWLDGRSEPAEENAWTTHYTLRLAYENQMLEAQGGRAAFVEMIPGGFIGNRQIQKVNKSSATGRVVSVAVKVPAVTGWEYRTRNVKGTDYALTQIDTERLPADAYRAPTEAELADFHAAKKAAPKGPALVNLTDEDAELIQAEWNAHAAKTGGEYSSKPGRIIRMTQAEYSNRGGDWFSTTYTHGVKIRTRGSLSGADCVVLITDKPRKSLPAGTWAAPAPAAKPQAPAAPRPAATVQPELALA